MNKFFLEKEEKMSSNSLNIISKKDDDDRVDPRFYHLSSPKPNNIENIEDLFENLKEVSENNSFSFTTNIYQIEQNETQNKLNLNSNDKEIENERKEAQIPHDEIKNKIENMVLPEDIFILKKNLAVKKLNEPSKSKDKDILDNLSKEINSLTACIYGENKMSKKKGSSILFLKRKRNSK